MTGSATRLRARLADLQTTPLVVPGVGTPLEAHAVAAAGFSTVYLSGYAVSAWRHGVPDVGLIALEEISGALAAVTEVVDLEVICDADTGYGDVANAARTVRRLERVGAAAIQLEDQAWPKRCGHLRGKIVIGAEEHARKIRAAVRARQDPDTVIIARTDALAPNGMPDTIERALRYADAGADVLFVDAPASVEDLQQLSTALAGHTLVANMSESGFTPQLSAAEFHALGYGVILFPTSGLRIASRVLTDFFSELRATGDSSSWIGRMNTLDGLNELVGLGAVEAFDAAVTAAAGDGLAS